MIRRLKTEVLPELPPKSRTVIPLEINNLAEYQEAERDIISWIAKTEGVHKAIRASFAQHFTRFEKLKQLAVAGKLKAVEIWIREVLAQDHKILMFCAHHKTVDHFMSLFKDIAVQLDGRTSNKQRVVDQFQSDNNIRIAFCNTKEGLNLTAADTVGFCELYWSAGKHDQAEDRAWRMMQERPVNVYYLIAANTIEERIASIIDRKRTLKDAVLDGRETEKDALLTELIHMYKKQAG